MQRSYRRLLERYLRGGGEEQEQALYRVSQLGRAFLGAGYGPEDVVQLHHDALRALPAELQDLHPNAQRSMEFLTEAMIAFGVRHRQQIQIEMENAEAAGVRRAELQLAEMEERLRSNRQRLRDQDDFVAFIAHELRRPLTTIVGYAELAQRQEDPERVRQSLQRIHQAARMMTKTCDLLLELSDQERDFALTEFADVNLQEVLDEVVALSEVDREQTGVNIDVHIETPSPIVRGDETGLRAVFANLVSNAIKYNRPQGRVTIESSPSNGMIEIRVSDTGIGIPESEIPHIFNRYYRIAQATSGSPDGTGLGLALTEYIVQQHGGEIQVQSQFGHGSQFRVRLPGV